MNKPNKETVIRTIILFIALINQILTMTGKNPLPFAEDDLYAFLTGAATIIASVWAWWKNNSFTKNAIEADKYLKSLKENDKK